MRDEMNNRAALIDKNGWIFSQSMKTFVQKHVGENQTLLGHIWACFLCNSAALNNSSVFKIRVHFGEHCINL